MIPLYSTEQVRLADNFAINTLNIPSIVLMENAARSIFSKIKNYYDLSNKKITILVGKGNNGGDGLALARHLIINDFQIKVILLSEENSLSTDSRINLNILKKLITYYPQNSIINFTKNSLKVIKNSDIIIDAIFGTGISGAIKEPYKSVIEFVNKLNAIRIAIDVPSGLNSDTGYAETAFKADLTVTLAGLKKGLFINDGKYYSGIVTKGSIGIGNEFFKSCSSTEYLIEHEDILDAIPKRSVKDNKYSTGKVLVIAGSKDFIGAAALTANSAMKSGSGAVVVACPASLRSLYQKHLLEPTTLAYEDNQKGILQRESLKQLISKIEWADSIVIGPGLGREEVTKESVRLLLQKLKSKKVIIDADAIYAIINSNLSLKNFVLTPHHKEFADLLGIGLCELKKDLLFWGKKFVEQRKAYLVLKGSPTIIFTPDGDALINSTGNPGMAKFGVGDVLSGMIASFISKKKKIESGVTAAVYLHSLSADLLKIKRHELTYTAKDILENFDDTFKFISNSLISKNNCK